MTTTLQDVAAILAEKGYDAAYEYLGYIGVTLPDGRTANFGDANMHYDARWHESGKTIEFFMPPTATVPELVAAIEDWIGTNLLSGTATEILRRIIAAMQDAEKSWGREDYVILMEAIAFEANRRILNCRETHGGVQ